MGTSTRWKGPAGGRWSNASRRLARLPEQPAKAALRLESIADDQLRALHETLRADRSAFGLYDVASAAGEQLARVMGSLAAAGEESADALLARLIREVGGDGGTLADAAVRRGLATAVRDVRALHPELDHALDTGAARGGIASDILCDLYRFFFAGLVAEFLRSVVAEHLKLAVPVLIAVDPEERIAGSVANTVLGWLPSPCERADAPPEPGPAADPSPEPPATLPEIAASMVPEVVGRALGLTTEETTEETTGRRGAEA
ncbi:hypothetical protein GCM10009757_38730 [Streptomyces cheonanensis]|uniref:Uncharacterized protein n=1 Tax=Streptomyces cheonanensis TaxID=312720 RepID=A0ABN2VCT0_9ACTN